MYINIRVLSYSPILALSLHSDATMPLWLPLSPKETSSGKGMGQAPAIVIGQLRPALAHSWTKSTLNCVNGSDLGRDWGFSGCAAAKPTPFLGLIHSPTHPCSFTHPTLFHSSLPPSWPLHRLACSNRWPVVWQQTWEGFGLLASASQCSTLCAVRKCKVLLCSGQCWWDTCSPSSGTALPAT